MAVYLDIGDVLDLHQLETNGKSDKYVATNPPGTMLTYAGMPNPQTFSFIYTRPYENGVVSGPLFFRLEVGQNTREITVGNIKHEVSDICPDRILLQFLTIVEKQRYPPTYHVH